MTRRPILVALSSIILLAAAAAAGGTTPLAEQVRATEHGPPNDPTTSAVDAAVAHNPVDNEYLLVWEGGVPGVLGKTEIYGRLLNADGTPKGDQFAISATPGDQTNDARTPDVIFDAQHEVYFVVWQQRTGIVPRGDILGRQVTRAGVPTNAARDLTGLNLTPGPMAPAVLASDPAVAWNPVSGHALLVWSDDRPGQGGNEIWASDEITTPMNDLAPPPAIRVSDMGGNAPGYAALDPDVAYDPGAAEFLVVWRGDDNTAPLVNDEDEIFGQRVRIGPDPAAPPGQLFEEVGEDTRISDAGPDGNTAYHARNPAVSHDAGSGNFLVVWQGLDGEAPAPAEPQEIYGRRVAFSAPSGISLVGDDTRYSDMGPDGDPNYQAQNPAVVANPVSQEFLVAWDGDDNTGELANNEEEVFVQRVAADGSEIQGDTVVSDMGPVIGSTFYRGARPTLAFNPATSLYLAAWEGDDDSVGVGQPGVDDEFEIWTRRIAGGQLTPPPGTPPGGGVPGTDGAPSAPNCAPEPDLTGAGPTGTLTLSATQLKINQRIGQAAVRRANAIQAWLDEGIVGGDVCGGALGAGRFEAGVQITQGLLGPIPTVAGPRPLVIPGAQDKGNVRFTLSTDQLRTNQRVYAAAVRRANALRDRLSQGLTGGDLRDGLLGRDRLRQDFRIVALTPAASPPPASQTQIASAASRPARFELTLEQLKINQRIAQAAVRRTNALRVRIASGLRDENFAPGSITAVDLAP